MDTDKLNLDEVLNRYLKFVDNLSIKFNYNNNIRHVLYIIVPSFIIKYGIKNERKILNIFENTKIIINETKNNYNIASFNRKIIKTNNSYQLDKKIILYKYNKIPLIDLIDSIIHEFNHAINSFNNEITIDNKYIYLRSGIVYTKYEKLTLNKILDDSNSIVLEEILNTIQTENIINIILSFSHYKDKIKNIEIINMLYALSNEVNSKYTSKAYKLQTFISRELVKNSTFISTINQLRFSGHVLDIHNWFDDITGKANSYNKLCNKLSDISKLEQKYIKARWLKKYILYKIKVMLNEITTIIESFNNNCLYK